MILLERDVKRLTEISFEKSVANGSLTLIIIYSVVYIVYNFIM